MMALILKQKMVSKDLKELTDLMFPFAQDLLSKHDSFPPFGATVSNEDEIAILIEDQEDLPPPHEIIEHMTAQMREQFAEKKIQLGAMCLDVQVATATEGEMRTAICAHFESREIVMQAFLPYQKVAGEYQYGDVIVQKATSGRMILL
jgi:hypothetical protein